MLDADCAQLREAVRLVDDALRSARDQADELASAWSGRGGEAVTEFVRRHCLTASALTDGVRNAAEATARLRDELWGTVDRKVAATVSIDDRSRLQRPGWLAAARSISAGSATEADEIIDAEVKPFVDNDVRDDWVAAMRSATAAVTQSYRAAEQAIGARAGVRFDVPGDLGPRFLPPASPASPPAASATAGTAPAGVVPTTAGPSSATPAAPVRPPSDAAIDALWPGDLSDVGTPADFMAGPTAPTPTNPPAPTPASVPLSSAANPLDAWASPGSAPALGGGPAGLAGPAGGGLAGLSGGLADALGALLGGSGKAPLDSLEPPDLADETIDDGHDDPDRADDEPGNDEPGNHEPGNDEPGNDEGGEGADDVVPGDPAELDGDPEHSCDEVTGPDQPTPPAGAQPEVAAPPSEQPPSPAPADPGPSATAQTPCEIAADELPQAGE